jgi:hypothetical protein
LGGTLAIFRTFSRLFFFVKFRVARKSFSCPLKTSKKIIVHSLGVTVTSTKIVQFRGPCHPSPEPLVETQQYVYQPSSYLALPRGRIVVQPYYVMWCTRGFDSWWPLPFFPWKQHVCAAGTTQNPTASTYLNFFPK